MLIRLYTKRLGAPSAEVVARLENGDNVELLHEMIDRCDEQFESWEQLFLPANINQPILIERSLRTDQTRDYDKMLA